MFPRTFFQPKERKKTWIRVVRLCLQQELIFRFGHFLEDPFVWCSSVALDLLLDALKYLIGQISLHKPWFWTTSVKVWPFENLWEIESERTRSTRQMIFESLCKVTCNFVCCFSQGQIFRMFHSDIIKLCCYHILICSSHKM